MPRCNVHDIPDAGTRWPTTAGGAYKCVHWGDLEVALTTLPGPLDCTQNYKDGGLPGGVCPCPHYGYVFEGTMRAIYPDTDWPDDVCVAGDVYYIPAGHVLVYEEASKVLEFNPAAALNDVMNAMQRASDKRAAEAQKA